MVVDGKKGAGCNDGDGPGSGVSSWSDGGVRLVIVKEAARGVEAMAAVMVMVYLEGGIGGWSDGWQW